MRFRSRHAHATIVKYVSEQLDAMGWINPPINFGSVPVTVQDFEAYGSDQGAIQPEPNLVAVTLDPEGPDEDEELGGSLISGNYQFYCDVVGESIPISVSIADDLLRKTKNAKIPLLDFTTDSAGVETAGHALEFYNCFVATPDASASIDRRTWRVVSGFVRAYSPDDTDL